MEGQLEQVSQVMMEWQQKYIELDKEKESLAQEMVQALENKEQVLETIDKELSDYVEKGNNMEKNASCSGKPINELGKRQKARIIKADDES